MIYTNIKSINPEEIVSEKIKKAIDYARKNDLRSLEPGSYPIEGDEIFVNIGEYESSDESQKSYESHRKYLDLQLMLEGNEVIKFNSINKLQGSPFDEENDYMLLKGEAKGYLVMEEGDIAIFFPNDGHMPGIINKKPSKVKKAVFKIKL